MQVNTFFAPAGRADDILLAEQQLAIIQAPFIAQVLNAIPDMMLVLNKHRQIVAVNNKLMTSFGVNDPATLTGLRPGEAVSCIHSNEGTDGCGTAEKCSACGAVLTILACQESGKQSEDECRVVISRNGGTALDLEVQATPIDVSGTTFTIFALKDIGSDKRRKVLERTFFHDILNTIGGINGIANLLRDNDGQDAETDTEYKQIIVDLSDNLVEEISQQRRLLSAESGEYVPDLKSTNLKELVEDVCKLYGNHVRTPDRTVILENVSECKLPTDGAMLRRVVGNMVINALEASPVGGTVKISLFEINSEVFITVTNIGEIPEDVQLRIFKRSFSTKNSSGRGIGTYSMKLFGERYLGGKVGFKSQNGQTMFSIQLPIDKNRA